MNWLKYLLAVVISAIAMSLTDWLFFGILFHDKYNVYPEVWRASMGGGGEMRAIGISIAIGVFTCAVFLYSCIRLGLYTYGETLKLAVWMWLTLAVPILVTNSLFMKLDPSIIVAHSIGWFARLAIAAIVFCLVFRRHDAAERA